MCLENLQSALAGLAIGPLRYYDRIDSTNTEAAIWVDQGAPDLALVVADEQTAGRGRYDRKWFTPPDSSLAFSLVLRCGEPCTDLCPDSSAFPGIIPRMTALGSLAVSQALQTKYNLIAQIKWPNDVLLNERKTAGILVEAHWQGELLVAAILGIGINVAPESVPPEEEIIFPATCIQAAYGQSLSRMELLRSVLEHLLEWRWRLGNPEFIKAWEEQLAFRGQWVTLITESDSGIQETHQGMVLGLDDLGGLRLRDHTGQEFTLRMGEIRTRPMIRL